MTELKPGLYRLTKSFVNPHLEKVTHRDLMGVIRVLPKDWDWLVYHEGERPYGDASDDSPLMVMAACGHWCEGMYVHEADYKEAMVEWDAQEDHVGEDPPLLAPPEFLAALEPREADTFTRIKQLHKFSEAITETGLHDVIERLIEDGKLDPKDLLEAVTLADKDRKALESGQTTRKELWNRQTARKTDQELYSKAVNEVFNETGDHWID